MDSVFWACHGTGWGIVHYNPDLQHDDDSDGHQGRDGCTADDVGHDESAAHSPCGSIECGCSIRSRHYEACVGGVMGLAVMLLFGALAFTGQLIGVQMGFAIANVVDPTTNQQNGVLAQVLNLMGLSLF